MQARQLVKAALGGVARIVQRQHPLLAGSLKVEAVVLMLASVEHAQTDRERFGSFSMAQRRSRALISR